MSYQHGYAPQVPVRTDQQTPNGAVVAIAWVCALLTSFYMLPWAVAATRGRSNQAAVGVVNLLLGWTFVGWIVALVMACSAHQVVAAPVAVFVGHVQASYTQPPAVQARPADERPPLEIPSPPKVLLTKHDTSKPSVPAGWYAAPTTQGQEYWDGARWTGHRAP
ncbi:superinfection immunity protein [Cellulomonas sp. URHD0024]|uniref:superinfection immunity protein n=1 Tax=Cellulomonas sp. URHD0024 TaxID=1302620 RepID=UPI0004254CFA|nr:superinfection immunity protein [Cellulomonas sp. URHD0024]